MHSTYHKKTIGLLLALFLTMAVGCSPESRIISAAKDLFKTQEKLLDIYKTIDDKESLEAAEPKLRGVFTEIAKIEIKAQEAQKDLKKKYEDAKPEKQFKVGIDLLSEAAEVAEDMNASEIQSQLATEKTRVNRIPGARVFIQKIQNEVAKKMADGSKKMERALGYREIREFEPKPSKTKFRKPLKAYVPIETDP